MKVIMSRIGFILAMSAATLSIAEGQEIGSPRQGQQVARAQCAECHLVDKVESRSPNADVPSFGRIANTPGMTSAALIAALRTSHKTMPNVIIKASNLRDIVAYILSLKDKD
jgi:mono/diheme cytochrome c family protein